MAKRFGRNQRRHLRNMVMFNKQLADAAVIQNQRLNEQLSGLHRVNIELRASLQFEQGCEWPVADGEELMTIPLNAAFDWEDTLRCEGRKDGNIKRIYRQTTATLPLLPLSDTLMQRLHENYLQARPVAFRGTRFQLDQIDVDHGTMTFKMTAIGRRNRG